MFGLTLIAVLAVMGGAIAYTGDILGSKVGKRKLTVFHLRPKYTSIIVTIITGILIAAATIGVLALTIQDVRTALFGMEALKTELKTLSQDVAQKNSELDASRQALEAKNAEYKTLTDKIKETGSRLAEVSRELANVMAERDRTALELRQAQADYALARTDLDKAGREIVGLQETKNQLDNKVAVLNENKTALEADISHLKELTDNLRQGIIEVRNGAIAFRAGEVLYTSVLPNADKKDGIRDALANALYETNALLQERLNITDKNLRVLFIPQTDFDQAISAISSISNNTIIRVSSAGNILYGEPVIGRIELFENRLIYRQGETIFAQSFSVPKDKQEAEEMVFVFLLQKVNQAAIKSGMLADPLQGSVGVISAAQVYDTVGMLERYHSGRIQLSAVAIQDTYTVGPLKIDIRVQNME